MDDYGSDSEHEIIDERLLSDDENVNSGNVEDEAEEVKPSDDAKDKEKKTKRIVKNPQPKLNFQTLQGPKGLLALNELFSTFKFRGSGHELEDISGVLKRLEEWTFRLYPKFHFEDSLKRIEALGKKREVQVYLKKIRNDMIDNNEVIRQMDDGEEEEMLLPIHDDFDDLLSQQIAQTQLPPPPTLTDDQRARIERNKRLAMERRMQNANTPVSNMPQESTPMEDGTVGPVSEITLEDDAPTRPSNGRGVYDPQEITLEDDEPLHTRPMSNLYQDITLEDDVPLHTRPKLNPPQEITLEDDDALLQSRPISDLPLDIEDDVSLLTRPATESPKEITLADDLQTKPVSNLPQDITLDDNVPLATRIVTDIPQEITLERNVAAQNESLMSASQQDTSAVDGQQQSDVEMVEDPESAMEVDSV